MGCGKRVRKPHSDVTKRILTMTYKTLDDVRLHDATVHRMMRDNMSMTSIIIQLANEKADLMRDLLNSKVMHRPYVVTLPSAVTQSSPYIPYIPPNTPQ